MWQVCGPKWHKQQKWRCEHSLSPCSTTCAHPHQPVCNAHEPEAGCPIGVNLLGMVILAPKEGQWLPWGGRAWGLPTLQLFSPSILDTKRGWCRGQARVGAAPGRGLPWAQGPRWLTSAPHTQV